MKQKLFLLAITVVLSGEAALFYNASLTDRLGGGLQTRTDWFDSSGIFQSQRKPRKVYVLPDSSVMAQGNPLAF